MKKFILFTILLSAFCVFSQPSIQWQKCLGGAGYDQANSIQQTTDGCYIVAGISDSNDGDVTGNIGSGDYWIAKITNIGEIEWQKSLGGSGGDAANSIQQTTDGGYIVAGNSDSNDGDVTGNHGGFSDYWVVKLSNTGGIEWQKSLGGTGNDQAYSIQQTTDGSYIVAGFSESNDGDVTGNHGNIDYWIVKLNGSGVIEWQKSFGGTGSDWATSIQQTIDGGYVVVGFSDSNDNDITVAHGSNDYWVVKLTSVGGIEWQKSLGGTYYDSACAIQQTSDGGYIVAGQSQSIDGDVTGNHGYTDYWIVKLDNSGLIEWEKSIGGVYSEYPTSIQQTKDGGYIVIGTSILLGDCRVVKLSGNGNIEWQKEYGSDGGGEGGNSIQQTTDGGYIITGGITSTDVAGFHGDMDYWVIKLSGTLSIPETTMDTNFVIYPNPVKNEINVRTNIINIGSSYSIYDQLGKKVQTGKLNTENNIIDISNLSKSIYTFSIGDIPKTNKKFIKK